MKKKVLSAALLLLSALAVTGCGNQESGNNGGDNGGNNGGTGNDDSALVDENGVLKEKTTIYLWTTAGDQGQALLNEWVEEFKEVQPNITVTNVKQTGGYDDLQNMIVTGFNGNNYPDLAYCYPDHVADYIDYGKAVKLDSYIENEVFGWSDEDINDFVPAYLDEGRQYTVEGTYSLPFSKSTEAMFYNEDILMGLDLSSIDPTINGGNRLNAEYLENLTWEELFGKLAPALLKYDETVQDIIKPCDDGKTRVFGYDSDDNLFITLAHQYGYPYTSIKNGVGSIDFNTKEMKDKLLEFKDAYEKNYFITKGSNQDKYVNELFTANQLLFSVGSTGGIKYQFDSKNPMNVGVGKIPQAENGTPSTIMQGPSMCILDHNDANRRLASWLFYKFITEPSRTLSWSLDSTGYYPIRKSNLEDEFYLEASDYENAQDKSIERLQAKGNAYYSTMDETLFTSPVFKGSSAARVQVGGLFTSTLLGGANFDIDAAFTKAVDLCKLEL